jgi:hypothetical protein
MEGRTLVEATLDMASKSFLGVKSNIRGASITETIGLVVLLISGEDKDLNAFEQWLRDQGVKVEHLVD